MIKQLTGFTTLVTMDIGFCYWYHLNPITWIAVGIVACSAALIIIAACWTIE